MKSAMGTLSLMKFFPSDADFRGALVGLLREMCANDEQLEWLAQEMARRSEWPGPGQMRAIFCARFNPADGVYPVETVKDEDGNPEADAHIDWAALTPRELPRLEAADLTEDKEYQALLEELKIKIAAARERKREPGLVVRRKTIAELEAELEADKARGKRGARGK
jgi:hypothetical protein